MHTVLLRLITLGLLAALAGCDDPTRTPKACVDAPCPRQTDAPYVRSTDDATGTQERFWPQAERNCLTIQRAQAGSIGDAVLDEALERVSRSWTLAAQPCQAALCVRQGAPLDRAFELADDGVNLAGVIDDVAVWDRVPETSALALAVTITHVDANTGELLGADIAVNAAYYTFSQRRDGPRGAQIDLQSVLLHEVGHLLGFGHPAAGTDSVMVSELDVGVSRRALTAVDTAGVCETFARPDTASNDRRGEAQPKAVPSPQD
ncbi:MAG: hypothetical protein ACI9U2_002543 [Bradymonadia bacterium]|jgi:hypothetical protein